MSESGYEECLRVPLTVYPPEAVGQVIFAVHSFVTGSDVTEVACFVEPIEWRQRLQGKEAMIAVHFCGNACKIDTST